MATIRSENQKLATMKEEKKHEMTSLLTHGDPDMIHFSEEEKSIIWDLCRPKLKGISGTIIFRGTMGEGGIKDFEAMFYQSNFKEKETDKI